MQISKTPVIDNDPLAQVVLTVVDAMRSDFGERFTRVFTDAEQIRQLKRRLYGMLRGLPVCDIVDGYDNLVTTKPSYVPTVPEIVESAVAANKLRLKAEKEQAEADMLATLPPPVVVPDSAEKEKVESIRQILGRAAKEVSSRETEQEKQARLKRLAEKLEAHEQLLAKDFPGHSKPKFVDAAHSCAVSFCNNAGTISSSTSGGAFYCSYHFRKKA